jgi:glycosyltransferase involved in cell wall biosynthesis
LIDDKQVRYIGPVDKTQKIELLSQAYGFLNPINWEEPFGMVMIEAMALGCPVISFARGAASELVEHGKTGFLVQNLDEMVQAIPQLEQIDRCHTRKHVEQHFSARAMAQGYMRVYQKMIAGI